jgi:hypothetical protein
LIIAECRNSIFATAHAGEIAICLAIAERKEDSKSNVSVLCQLHWTAPKPRILAISAAIPYELLKSATVLPYS